MARSRLLGVFIACVLACTSTLVDDQRQSVMREGLVTHGLLEAAAARHAAHGNVSDGDLDGALRHELTSLLGQQVSIAARLDDVRLQNRQLHFEVDALSRTRNAIRSSLKLLSTQEATMAQEAASLAALSRNLLDKFAIATQERGEALARLATLRGAKNATDARAAELTAVIAGLVQQLGVADGQLAVATKALADREADLTQLVAVASGEATSLKREVSALAASKLDLSKQAAALQAAVDKLSAERAALLLAVNELEAAVAAAQQEVRLRTAAAEVAENALGEEAPLLLEVAVAVAVLASSAPSLCVLPPFPPPAAVAEALSKAVRAADADLATASAARRALDTQLHEQQVRAAGGGLRPERAARWALRAELAQLASRGEELTTAIKSLLLRRDALTSQCAELDSRLSAGRSQLDARARERSQLQRVVAGEQAEADRLSTSVSLASSERVAVDNATIALLVRAASVRAAVVALGQEIYALRHPAEVAALARATAAAASGADDVDFPASAAGWAPQDSSGTAAAAAGVDPDSVDSLLRDISHAAETRRAISAGAAAGLPRFRAALSADAGEEAGFGGSGGFAHDARFVATWSGDDQPPLWLSNDTRSELQLQRDSVQAALGYAQAALDRALQQRDQWLADKLSVASATLDLKNQMDETVSRIEGLRDAYDNSSFALEDVKAAVADLDFQAELTETATAAATEAVAASEKAVEALDARRQELAMQLDDTQQQRVSRVVSLQSSIRDKLAARRSAASAISSAQRQRLSLAQDVNSLQQRVSLLQGTAASTSAAVEDLKQRRTSLSRQREVLAAELQSASQREAVAKQRLQPLAQRRDRLVAAAQRQASARDRLQAQAARTSALLESARAEAARRTADRAAVAAALSTLQLRLGGTEEEYSQVQAALQQAVLDLDQLVVRQRGLAGVRMRLEQRVQEARAALVTAARRRARAAANLADLDKRAARYAAIRSSLLPPSERPRSGNGNSNATAAAARTAANSSAAASAPHPAGEAGFASQILHQLEALSATVASR